MCLVPPGRPGSRCGYASSPLEIVNYASCHDNTTLFDSIQQKVDESLTIEERCRINRLGMAVVALSQVRDRLQVGVIKPA